MKAKVLDSRDDGIGKCYLCSISLEEYVNGLSSDYQEYDIQREIVSNVYLDHLVDTVLNRRHIPPIVLVADAKSIKNKNEVLEIDSFKILDGLQRTFRLKAIRETIGFCIKKLDNNEDYLSWGKFKFSRQFSADLRTISSNTEVLRSVLSMLKEQGRTSLLDSFRDNTQWFEVWTGLAAADEVTKMLTLNAGHKPVKTRHQLELLFLNLLPILRSGKASAFQLVREKDVSATQFSKSRNVGSFHFAHIVTALLSFYEGKPIAPSTGLIQSLQSDYETIEEYSDFANPKFLKEFVAFLVDLDRLVNEQYPKNGVFWMGREITLAGLFGALGAFAMRADKTRIEAMRQLKRLITANRKLLNLDQFEDERNALDLSKVNIGNANRAAVFSAVLDLMDNSGRKTVNWHKHFGGADQ